jgi:hypothetical protein
VQPFVLYHANCADGFGAAWAAWKQLGDAANYLPVRHGNPPPEIPVGASVYILDFCYARDVIVNLHARSRRLTVIDHHRTAEQELQGLDYAIFDNDKSGAVLAWEYFNTDLPVPALLRYVMDRDLWLYQLPRSREVFAALCSYPMDFRVWSTLDVERLADEGAPILRYQQQQVAALCSQARFDNVAGFDVPVVNAPVFGSEVGEELLKRYRDAPFAVVYFDRSDGIRQWSLRSREDFDVSQIAKQYQNGGHRQAAGFETQLNKDFVPKPKRKKPARRK